MYFTFNSLLVLVLVNGLSLNVSVIHLTAAVVEISPLDDFDVASVDDGGFAPPVQEMVSAAEFEVWRGQVVNDQGQPIPNTQLWLQVKSGSPFEAHTTSDDNGHFELKCPIGWLKTGRLNTMVFAYSPDYSLHCFSAFSEIPQDEDAFYTIQCVPLESQQFQLLRPDGQPLVNVSIRPYEYRSAIGYAVIPPVLRERLSVRTDEAGWVTLSGVQKIDLTSVELVTPEFGRQEIIVSGEWGNLPRTVSPRPAVSISGRLVCENPESVRGVKVTCFTDIRNLGIGKSVRASASTISDDEGNFHIPALAAGAPIHVYVKVDQNQAFRPRIPKNMYLRASEDLTFEIPMEFAAKIRGRIINKSTGVPVPNVSLMITHPEGGTDQTTSDENGRYIARALPGKISISLRNLPDGLRRPSSAITREVPDSIRLFTVPTIKLVPRPE